MDISACPACLSGDGDTRLVSSKSFAGVEAATGSSGSDDMKTPCEDCGSTEGAPYVSCSFAVHLCPACAAVHRELPSPLNNIRSLCHDSPIEDKILTQLASNNNSTSKFTNHVPRWYYQPQPTDCLALREQWIHAKYIRREFVDVDSLPDVYSHSPFEVMLYKKSRAGDAYEPKLFHICERTGVLRYCPAKGKFATPGFRLSEVDACFVPDKMQKTNGLQLLLPQLHNNNQSLRSVFVYSDNSEDVVNLFQVLRCVKYHILQTAFPMLNDEQLFAEHSLTSTRFRHEGYLRKATTTSASTTGSLRDSGRRRWYTLYGRYMYCYDKPLDAYPRSQIFIGHRDMGYHVERSLVPFAGRKGSISIQQTPAPMVDSIALVTPRRDYVFAVDSSACEAAAWFDALQTLIVERIPPKDVARYRSLGENL